ncbi:MAG TPA: SDR family oxidoreductase [Myxococcota bacterium]|nr:SDR family oxidoreductase [Myxococcota bacterium]
MDLQIAGRVALVSGGSRGLGRASALRLAQEGVCVVIAARSQPAIDETVATIVSAGGRAVGVAADMTTAAGVAAANEAANRTFGPPDIAIANVHSPSDGDFFEVDEPRFHDAFQRLTVSIALLARAVVPAMRTRRWGRIVNIASGSAKEPPRELRHVLGNTARASGITLCKSLANELGPDGITVNSIGTGLFRTGFMEDYFDRLADEHATTRERAVEAWCESLPMRRPGRPEEMAGLCAFLCSEWAGYLTGQLITHDGGFGRSAF